MRDISLVFSGGGAKGAYEVGVWKAMKELNIDQRVRYVSGTSVGSLNGAMFVQGTLDRALNIWEHITMDQILAPKDMCDIDSCTLDHDMKQELYNEVQCQLPYQFCKLSWLKRYDKAFTSLLLPIFIHRQNSISLSLAKQVVPLFLQILKRLSSAHNIKDAITISLYYLTSIMKEGLFSQEGLRTIIHDNLRPDVILLSNKKAIIHAYNISKWKATKFLVNRNNISNIDNILLASCAIPFIYESIYIDGDAYIDGGIPFVGENVPIESVLDKTSDIIVVVMSNDYELDEKYEKKNIHVIKPSDDLGGLFDGTLNFQNDYMKKLIQTGYEDGMQQLTSFASNQISKKV